MSDQQSQEKRSRSPIIHRDKLFGGRQTAEEVHMQALAQPCTACGAPALVTIKSYVPFVELRADQLAACATFNPEKSRFDVPVMDSTYGKLVRIGIAYACSRCKPAALKQAAHVPSNVLVVIDEGPGPDNPIVQVA